MGISDTGNSGLLAQLKSTGRRFLIFGLSPTTQIILNKEAIPRTVIVLLCHHTLANLSQEVVRCWRREGDTMLSLLTALHSLPLHLGDCEGWELQLKSREVSQSKKEANWVAGGAPPQQPYVEWSPLLLCTSLCAPVLCECCMPKYRAEGRGRWKDEWLSLSHRPCGHCATVLPTATSVLSISPALIVPSPALSPVLGVHPAWLTLVNCTAANQQLIPVESNTICIRVRKKENHI